MAFTVQKGRLNHMLVLASFIVLVKEIIITPHPVMLAIIVLVALQLPNQEVMVAMFVLLDDTAP